MDKSSVLCASLMLFRQVKSLSYNVDKHRFDGEGQVEEMSKDLHRESFQRKVG